MDAISSEAAAAVQRRTLIDRLLEQKGIRPRATTTQIPRRTPAEPSPLSFAQQRLWLACQLEPGNPAYHLPLAVRLGGTLDVPAARGAAQAIVARHELLRATFDSVDGVPRQAIGAPSSVPLALIDLETLPAPRRIACADRLARAFVRRPFDLPRGPVVRGAIVRLDAHDHVLVFALHHIVADGWSLTILAKEFSALYRAATLGVPANLPDLPVQYTDYAAWQRSAVPAEQLERHLAYWQQRLAGVPRLALRTDRAPRPANDAPAGVHPLLLDEPAVARIAALCRREEVTPFVVLLAAFAVLLARYSGRRDFAIGSPVTGRDRVELHDLIGLFVSQVAFRFDMSPGRTVRDLLHALRAETLEAFAHQDVPFGEVIDRLRPVRHADGNLLFEASFVLQQSPPPSVAVAGLATGSVPIGTGAARFNLELALWDEGATLRGRLTYRADLFEAATIASLADGFQRAVAIVSDDVTRRLGEVALHSAAEREAWTRESYGPRVVGAAAIPAHRMFEAMARVQPTSVAVEDASGGETCTYAELNQRANRLARQLRQLGIRAEARVALCIPRSRDLIVSLLAVLKAGGAYVPVDAETPGERLGVMLRDARVALVLTSRAWTGAVAADDGRVIEIERLAGDSTRQEDGDLPETPAEESLAYIIYTSGSSGVPKGVMLPHGALANYLAWSRDAYLARPGGGAPWHTSLAYDLSVTSVLTPLVAGDRVVVIPDDGDLDVRAEAIAARPGGLLKLTPAHLDALASLLRPERVRTLAHTFVIGGEALKEQALAFWRTHAPATRIVNEYGPTEAAVGCCVHVAGPVPDTEADVPIGRPIANTQLCVLDPDDGPALRGAPGELYIGGAGLARGYAGRPDLTAERFVPNPFGPPGSRLYRTGDDVRQRADGSLVYRGRRDRQVQVRGVRVEPREIEAVLAAHPDVQEAVVVARDDASGAVALDAYVTLREPQAGASAAAGPAALRDWMAARLPAAMRPASLTPLERLPLTPHGKVDRGALPAPVRASGASGDADAVGTAIEELVRGIWAKLFQRERVELDDDFLALGGDSILATQVISRVRDLFGVEPRLRTLFESSTVSGLARAIQQMSSQGGQPLPPLEPIARGGPLPLSFAQLRLWFLQRLDPRDSSYNLPLALRLRGEVDFRSLRRSLDMLVARHEVLRTCFVEIDGEPAQQILEAAAVVPTFVDLRALEPAAREAAARALTTADARRPFALDREPPLRAHFFQLASDDGIAVFTLHHIACDGWSTGVLIREWQLCYRASVEGRAPSLPALAVQYADYAAWERRWLDGPRLEAQLDYWARVLDGARPDLAIGRSRSARPTSGRRRGQHLAMLPPALGEEVRKVARAEDVTPFMLLLAAFLVVLHFDSGEEDLVVGTDIANRRHRDVESLVGFFVNQLALRTSVAGAPTFRALLARVREVTLGAYEHQDVPFEQVVRRARPARQALRAPLFSVMFVLQNTPMPSTALPAMRIESYGAPLSHAKFDIILTVAETPDGLAQQLEYDADRIEPAAAPRLTERFEQVLRCVVRRPDETVPALVHMLSEGERAHAAAGRERYASALERRLHGRRQPARPAGDSR